MNLVLVVEEVPVGVAVGRREEGFDGKLVWKEFEHHAKAENGNDEENTALLQKGTWHCTDDLLFYLFHNYSTIIGTKIFGLVC